MKKNRVVAITMLLILAFGTFAIRTNAQDIKTLKKENAKTIKTLKKGNDLKNVEIKIVESGNYWYYLLVQKVDKSLFYGVANSDGKVIIQPSYSEIQYIPSWEEGFSDVPTYIYDYKNAVNINNIPKQRNGSFKLYHKKSDGCYLCKDAFNLSEEVFNVSLYDLSGKELFTDKVRGYTYIPGYFIFGTKEYFGGDSFRAYVTIDKQLDKTYEHRYLRFNGTSMVSTAGKVLLSEPWSSGYIDEDNVLKYERIVDGVKKKGALKLDNDTLQIPCLFYQIRFQKGDGKEYSSFKDDRWYVQRNENDEYEDYVFGKDYNIIYRDKGEEYFDKGMYSSVISYYAEEGVDAPWAKYFTAQALFHEGLSILSNVRLLCESIEENSILQSHYNNENLDFDLAKKYFTTSIQAFDAYLEQDSIYAENAKMYRSIVEKEKKKDIPELKERLKKAYELLEQRKAAEELAALERARQEQEARNAQRNRFVMILANAFTNALTNSFLQPASSSSSYGTSGNRVSSGSSSSASSSSGNSNASKIADWERRKSNAEEMIRKYKEHLKKDPNNASYKQMLRSQENVLKVCEDNLRRLR